MSLHRVTFSWPQLLQIRLIGNFILPAALIVASNCSCTTDLPETTKPRKKTLARQLTWPRLKRLPQPARRSFVGPR